MNMKEHREIHFPGQRPNEHVVLMLRRHWTVLARDTVQLVMMLFVPPILLGFGFIFTTFAVEPNSATYVMLILGLSIYYLFTAVTYFHDFVDYHLDVWIVTDTRIVSIEQSGLFNRVISELNLTKLQDVTSEIKGKVQTLLDYGQVYVQTAGEQGRFIFEQVSHPAEVAKVVLQLHDRAVKRDNLEQVHEGVDYQQQVTHQQPPMMQPPTAPQGNGVPMMPPR